MVHRTGRMAGVIAAAAVSLAVMLLPSCPASALPSGTTVSFVIPNLCHGMHSCLRDSGDRWMQHHLGGYATWAESHNSLLVVTWDEDGTLFGLGGDGNKVATIFYGAHVRAGTYAEHTSHYGILRTVEDMYGLAHAGASATAAPITGVWT